MKLATTQRKSATSALLALTAVATLGITGCNVLDSDSGTDNTKPQDVPDIKDTITIGVKDTLPADSLTGTRVFTKTDRIYYLSGLAINGSITFDRKVSVVVLNQVNVTGSLTIKEGATLKFEEDAYLNVNGGKLTVSGSDSLPVIFQNRVAGKYWGYGSSEDYCGGIWFSSNANPLSSISYATISSANMGIYNLVDGISISHTTFKDNKYGGVNFATNSVGPAQGFTANSFTGNKSFPIRMYASQLTRFDGTQIFAVGEKPIYVKGSVVEESGVWRSLDVPYEIEGFARIENSSGVVLSIAAGADIIFNQGAYLQVGNSGTLKVLGTAADPVTMKPAETGKRWGYGTTTDYSGGIWIDPDASANTSFKHLHLDSAGTGIYVGVAGVKIDSSMFSGTEHQAIFFADNIVPGSLSGNSYTNSGKYSVSVPVEGVGAITNDCVYSGTSEQIRLLDGELKVSGTVKKLPVPYLVTGKLGIANADQEVVMTIQPGAHLKFLKGQWCELSDNGTLKAEGTAADPIIMENAVSGTKWGYGTIPTYCGGIWIESGATTNTKISYVTFKGVINNVPYYIQNNLSTANITNITIE